MGGSNSTEAEECSGFRVLGVQDGSPASKAGLVSFFDFIIAANGISFDKQDAIFIEILKQNISKPVCLTVYNFKAGSTRGVVLTPSDDWPGQGLLGVTISWDSYYEAEEHVLRILDIEAGSPAQEAGLAPLDDFLLGTIKVDFKDLDLLNQELHRHLAKPLEVYVYNASSDVVRRVKVIANHHWGGEGCFGASVGSGYLHRLPESCRGTVGKSEDIGTPSIPQSLETPKELDRRANGEQKVDPPQQENEIPQEVQEDNVLEDNVEGGGEEQDHSRTPGFGEDISLGKMKENYKRVQSEVIVVREKNSQLQRQIASVEEELDEAIYHLELLNELAAKIPVLEAQISTYQESDKGRIKS
mmetsp:Transcript_4916/g.6749  ORF Transcript_4916/g.6749 Transcript_4916/m.6749 type:complete len:357 (+) Transcript_4916:137-1207(+)